MARAALNVNLREVGRLAGVMTSAIKRVEAGEAVPEPTLSAIRMTFESAGLIFITENGGGPGVRLRDPLRPTSENE